MSKAIEDVIAERRRQIEVEGWTPEHDEQHNDMSLAVAAACYATHYAGRSWLLRDLGEVGAARYREDEYPNEWPDSWATEYWKPKDPRRDLVRAAALIIAEIDRLDREAETTNG